MNFCRFCGAQLPPQASICPQCHRPLQVIADTPPEVLENVSANRPAPDPPWPEPDPLQQNLAYNGAQLAQEQPSASTGQSPISPPHTDTGATTPIEARVHAQISALAKRFLTLFDAIPQAGLVRQMSGKSFQGVVISAANVYSGPSTQETLVLVAPPGAMVSVLAQVAGEAFPTTGNVWYRISMPSEPPRYIYAGLVIQFNLHQSLQRYFQLATQLWEAAAADHIEELAHNTAYQAAVTILEHQLERLQELCQITKQDPHARGSWRWQRQVRLYRRALDEWLRCLGEDPSTMFSDPTECGRILYRAQGCLGLASCNGFDYALIKSLQVLNVLISLFLLLVLAILMVEFLTHDSQVLGTQLLETIVTLLVLLFAPVYLLWLSAMGTSLPVIMGYALTREQAPDAARPGPAGKARSQISGSFQSFFRACLRIPPKLWNISPRLLRYWLRVWGVLGGLVLLLLAVLLFSSVPPDPLWIDSVAIYILTFSVFYTSALFLIIVPFTLTMQAQMCRELITHPQRPPEARRSAVRPAIKLLSFHTISFLAIALTVLHFVPAFGSLAAPVSSALPSFITLRQVIYLPGLVLLYLLCLEFPYRWGVRRWEACQLSELAGLRKEFDRRLSQAPSQPADRKEQSSTQDDYARWQYYRDQEEEVKKTQPGLFSLVQQGWILLITFATSFLLDQAKNLLAGALKIPPFPH